MRLTKGWRLFFSVVCVLIIAAILFNMYLLGWNDGFEDARARYMDRMTYIMPTEEPQLQPQAQQQSRQMQLVQLTAEVTYIEEAEEIEEPVQITYADRQPSAKTYMDYRAITDRTSNQWALIHDELTICEDGMLRSEDGYIAAALGSRFGAVGSKWIFTMEREDGTMWELKIIKTDEKQDIHTDETHTYGIMAGEVIEFVIDSSVGPVWENGYVWSGNFNNNPEYEGAVIGWRAAE